MLQLTVVTPEGNFLEASAEMVELPTVGGQLGILAGHVPLITAISAGEVRIHQKDGMRSFAIAGGFLEVSRDTVRILASFASEGEEEAQIDQACERAREALAANDSVRSEVIENDLAALRAELAALKGIGKKPVR